MRGSVVDLAVGIIIGGAFQKIVSSLVNDVLTPGLSMLTGGINFTDRNVVLREGVIFNYGAFIQNVVDFVLIAFVIFLMVKAVNRVRRAHGPEPATPPAPTTEEKLLAEIRDLLKDRARS